MRQGQNSKRSRGRGAGRRNVPPRHQTFDSNGPSVRIRGSAYQVHEKYLALARDAGSAGDRIAAENYYQHAEHYFRIINMDNDGDGRGRGQPNGVEGRGGSQRDGQDAADPEFEVSGGQPNGEAGDGGAEIIQPNGTGEQPDLLAEEEAAEPAPKRRSTRATGRGRGRAASKASDSDDGAAPSVEE